MTSLLSGPLFMEMDKTWKHKSAEQNYRWRKTTISQLCNILYLTAFSPMQRKGALCSNITCISNPLEHMAITGGKNSQRTTNPKVISNKDLKVILVQSWTVFESSTKNLPELYPIIVKLHNRTNLEYQISFFSSNCFGNLRNILKKAYNSDQFPPKLLLHGHWYIKWNIVWQS